MNTIIDSIKSIFFPSYKVKRKTLDPLDLSDRSDNNESYTNCRNDKSTDNRLCESNTNNYLYKYNTSRFFLSQKKPRLESESDRLSYKFTLPTSIGGKGDTSTYLETLDENVNSPCSSSGTTVTSTCTSNASYSKNTQLTTELPYTKKSYLLNSNYLDTLTKPSAYEESRKRELRRLELASKVNKEQTEKMWMKCLTMVVGAINQLVCNIVYLIKSILLMKILRFKINREEKTYMEDIADRFREICTIPSLIFPRYTKKPTLPKITDDMINTVDDVISTSNNNEIIIRAFNLEVNIADLLSLQPGQWLTDNVINFYLELINDRSSRSPNLPRIQILSSFFYPKLASAGYSSVRRWTKRRPIFNCSILLIPIHLGNHWCLVSVDFDSNEVYYYDSLKSRDMRCLEIIKNFLIEDSQDKLNQQFKHTDWIFKQIFDGPSQLNGYDCGVFLCQTAEYISRRSDLLFTQDNMPYFRQKMSYEIVSQALL